MKRMILMVMLSFFYLGCQPSDLEPSNVTKKMILMKDKIQLNMNKDFIKNTLQKKDISEEEFNKLKQLVLVALEAKDFKTVRKIVNFEPYRERILLEKETTKFIKNRKYSNIDFMNKFNELLNKAKKLHMSSIEKKLLNSKDDLYFKYKSIVWRTFHNLMIKESFKDKTIDYILTLAKNLYSFNLNRNGEIHVLIFTYVDYKLDENINFDISPICNELKKLGFNKYADDLKVLKAKKMFEYAKNQLDKNVNFDISPICNELKKLGFNKYADDLKVLKAKKMFEYAKNQLDENINFDISPICNELKKLGFSKYADDLEVLKAKKMKAKKMFEYAKNQLDKNVNFDISPICNKLKKLGFSKYADDLEVLKAKKKSKVLSNRLFKKLVKENYPNYCSTKNKIYYLDYKNDFGKYVKTKFIASKAVLGMKERLDLTEFERDIDRIYFFAFLIKNNNFFERIFLSDSEKDDEHFYYSVFLSSFLKNSGNFGYIPLINLTIENLQTRKANFQKKVSSIQIANGILSYLFSSNDEEELKEKMLLLTSYLLVYSKGDPMVSSFYENTFKNFELSNSDILIFFLKTILKNTRNPKIQNLIYLLVNENSKRITKFMLNDKKTKQLFNLALEAYKKASKCY